MKRLLYILSIAGLTAGLVACHEEFLEEQAYDFIGPSNFYNSAQELEDMVSGVPRIFRESGSGMMGRHWWLLAETPAPYTTNRYNVNHLRTQYDSWTYGPGNSYLITVWRELYEGVNRANAVIDNASKIEDNTEEPAGYRKVDRVLAEARFYRALIYFYLTEFWGDVPLRTSETTSLDSLAIGNTPRADIYDLIIDDLQYAETNLPDAWEYEASTNDIGRPSKGGAKALLGKVYLTRGQRDEAQANDLQNADAKFQEVIDAGYGLAPSYSDLQYYNNPSGSEDYPALNWEILYEVQFTSAGFGASGNYSFSPRGSDIGRNKWTVFAAEFDYVESFEPGDERFDANFVLEYHTQNEGELVVYDIDNVIGDGYQDEALSFTQRLDPEPANENREEPNMQVLRYADVLLMKAEVLDLLGRTNEAYDYVNMVRRRAWGGDPVIPNPEADWPVGSKADFRQELYKERLKELPFMTWGTQDLRRMWDVATPLVEASSQRVEIQLDADGNEIEITNDGPKWEITDFSEKFKYFPIPNDAIDRNAALQQHPEWQ